MKKAEYLDLCRRTSKELEEGIRPIYQYDRNKQGRRQGVVLAFLSPVDNLIHIGWSRCHDKKDTFDRNVAMVKAFDRSMPLEYVRGYLLGEELLYNLTGEVPVSDVPHSIRKLVQKMVNRAERYFQPEAADESETGTQDEPVANS